MGVKYVDKFKTTYSKIVEETTETVEETTETVDDTTEDTEQKGE